LGPKISFRHGDAANRAIGDYSGLQGKYPHVEENLMPLAEFKKYVVPSEPMIRDMTKGDRIEVVPGTPINIFSKDGERIEGIKASRLHAGLYEVIGSYVNAQNGQPAGDKPNLSQNKRVYMAQRLGSFVGDAPIIFMAYDSSMGLQTICPPDVAFERTSR
jgi:hypothetical protein